MLKAPKGGKALTDNNIEILADKFEYNKITSRLIAKKNVVVTDQRNFDEVPTGNRFLIYTLLELVGACIEFKKLK